MQKAHILNHAVEFYIAACEMLTNPPEEHKEKVSEIVGFCKNVNKNIAQALSKEKYEEQKPLLEKAKESNKEFISGVRNFEKDGLFRGNSAVLLIGFSERTEIEINQLLNNNGN